MEDQTVKAALSDSLLTNAKLAKAVEVLMQYNLNTQEKVSMSKRIDACGDIKELEGTMNLIQKELHKGFIDTETGERWSPGFVLDIRKYYEQGFPFNPMEKLSELFRSIKEFIILQEVFMKLEEGERKDLMKSDMEDKRTSCNTTIKEFETLLAELKG